MKAKYIKPDYQEQYIQCAYCQEVGQHLWLDIENFRLNRVPIYEKKNFNKELGECPPTFTVRDEDIINFFRDNRYFKLTSIEPFKYEIIYYNLSQDKHYFSYNNKLDLLAIYDSIKFSVCEKCSGLSVWLTKNTSSPWDNVKKVHSGKLLYPNGIINSLPYPHPEMPEDVKEIYEEARLVFSNSPRASAALLRLATEMILKQLGLDKKNLNEMISELSRQDIDPNTKRGLDILRFYGNEGIHAGEINLNENKETVMDLFELINIVVEDLLLDKIKVNRLYGKLPETVRKAIEKRDEQYQ